MSYRILGLVLIGLAVSTMSLDAGGGKAKTAAAAGEIEIYKNKEGKYRYKILGADGKTIAMPLPQMHWDTKAECLQAIADLKKILDTTTPKEITDKK
jgi:uncharacterized protein YegP (UPF0339 family)